MREKLNGINKSHVLFIFIVFVLFFTIYSLAFSQSLIWPMFRHNPMHTGKSPYKGADIDIFQWKFKTDSLVDSSPAIGPDGTIYVGSKDENLYAINSNGTLKWKFKTDSLVDSSPAIGPDGTIYVGSKDGYLYAVNPDGTLKWKLGIGNEVNYSSPAISADGTIYIGGSSLYAVNPDGTLKWKSGIGGQIYSSPAIGSDGTIYFGSRNLSIYAVNPDGTLKWKFKTEREVKPETGFIAFYIYSSPAIGPDGTIYIGSRDKNLYALNSNGTLKWKFKTDSLVDSSPAIGPDGTIYIGSRDEYLYAINSNGTLKWKVGTGIIFASSPAISADGKIYVGATVGDRDPYLYAIKTENGLVTRFKIGDRGFVDSSPAIGPDGTIYIGSTDENLYAIGSPVSSPQIPSETTHPLQGSLHCPNKAGYTCPSCLETSGYVNHFKGFNILITQENCYVRLVTKDSSSIGNHDDCEVIIKGEKWLGLEDSSGTLLVDKINEGKFEFIPTNDFVEITMSFTQDGYQYEFADGSKEFRLYLSRNITESFQAVPWQNLSVEIKNKKTNKVFTYQFEKGIFPKPYIWPNGVANYGQCVWWAAKRWVEEVDSQKLFPFYPSSSDMKEVKPIDSNYQPKPYDVLIDYNPEQASKLGHYAFVEKIEDDLVYITQFNFIKPGEVYNSISRFWSGNPKSLYYSLKPHNEYYFKYYYRD